ELALHQVAQDDALRRDGGPLSQGRAGEEADPLSSPRRAVRRRARQRPRLDRRPAPAVRRRPPPKKTTSQGLQQLRPAHGAIPGVPTARGPSQADLRRGAVAAPQTTVRREGRRARDQHRGLLTRGGRAMTWTRSMSMSIRWLLLAVVPL